jgi:hypothetical protein
MRTHGSDRARRVGERVILQCSFSKGWTPRTPKTLTTAEHPGTTVMWDEECLEVVDASALPTGGIRYVLMPWNDSHTIRTIEHYDAESEALRHADYERTRKQRRASLVARLSGILLGFLPAGVQLHLQNELGVSATRMTMLSCILPLVAIGNFLYITVTQTMRGGPLPIPPLAWLIAIVLSLEAFVRFFVAMSQNRPMGSVVGLIAYALYRTVSRKRDRLPPVIGGRGDSIAFVPPSEEVALRDSFEVMAPLLTLLSADEQRKLAERFDYDYRKHAFSVAWLILVCSLLGVFTGWNRHDFGSALSMFVALLVAVEQAWRLTQLRSAPIGSIFGVLVRPIARDLLR